MASITKEKTNITNEIDILKRAKEVLSIEASAIDALADRLDENFKKAINLILNLKGRIVVTGMGKPGLIGRKISATFASTGNPSLFLHPAEAIHGDLGMILKDDLVIAISNSGETEEIVRLIPLIKRIGCSLISMTGNLKSVLAKNSDVVLDVGVKKEACSFGLVPTASSTAALAMGDAIAVVLLEKKGFKVEDYAFLHPGGDLGRKLMVVVKAVMRKGVDNPVILGNKTVKQAINLITEVCAGAVAIVDENNKLLGIFTDGDLRRKYSVDNNIGNFSIKDVMTEKPISINQRKLAVEALEMMQKNNIDELPVVDDDNKIVGMLDVQDLLKMGLV
jgi:arabinose-5-phosphate isomerase